MNETETAEVTFSLTLYNNERQGRFVITRANGETTEDNVEFDLKVRLSCGARMRYETEGAQKKPIRV